MKYILLLVDAQGQTVHIEAYGIDQITSDIESVSTENLANLFKGVSKDVTSGTCRRLDWL